jgi:hypothetical protein
MFFLCLALFLIGCAGLCAVVWIDRKVSYKSTSPYWAVVWISFVLTAILLIVSVNLYFSNRAKVAEMKAFEESTISVYTSVIEGQQGSEYIGSLPSVVLEQGMLDKIAEYNCSLATLKMYNRMVFVRDIIPDDVDNLPYIEGVA